MRLSVVASDCDLYYVIKITRGPFLASPRLILRLSALDAGHQPEYR